MKRIYKNSTNLLEIKKSKFITKLFYVTTLEEVNIYLEDTKNEYRGANHYCYAYIINHQQKASDDKEPSGTAGIPILEVLNKREMNYILCVVIRYFGGIKLGAGGLIRAYSGCVKTALDHSQIKDLEMAYHIKIKTDYKNENQLISKIGKENLIKKEYSEKLEIEAIVPISYFNQLKILNPEIIKKLWI